MNHTVSKKSNLKLSRTLRIGNSKEEPTGMQKKRTNCFLKDYNF